MQSLYDLVAATAGSGIDHISIATNFRHEYSALPSLYMLLMKESYAWSKTAAKSFINIHSRTMQWSGCYSHMGLLGY